MPPERSNQNFLDRAFQEVGRFMHHFALVEEALDKIIQKTWRLDDIQTRLIAANMSLRQKIEIVKNVINDQEASESWIRASSKPLSQIHRLGDTRNMFAHSKFLPTEGSGVQFHYSKAKSEKSAQEPIVVTFAEIQEHCDGMDSLCLSLEEIRRKIVSPLVSREYVYTFEWETPDPRKWLSGIEHEISRFSGSVIKWAPGESEYDMSYVTVAFPSPEHLSNYLKQYYDGSGDDFINEQIDSIRPRKGR